MLTDIPLYLGCFAFWLCVSKTCFTVFPCPDHLLPKNNKNKKTKAYYDYYGNYPSIVHAILAFIIGCYTLITEGLNLGETNSLLVKFVMIFSFTYFLYDTIISEYQRYNNTAMTIHHIVTLLITSYCLFKNSCGNEIIFALVSAEISNPFNLVREILRHHKRDGEALYLNCSLIFAALFIISRFGFVPWYLTHAYPGPTSFVIKFFAATVWFISWHWLFIILNFASKELKNVASKSDKSKGGFWGFFNSALTRMRKDKKIMFSFYGIAFTITYVPLVLLHDSSKAV